MKYLIPLSLLLTLNACKTTDSSLTHEWGRTLLPGGKLDCKEEPLTGPEASYRDYIREHLTLLAKANPEVFKDELEPEKFCIVPVVYEEIDAGASLDGSLFINTGVLRAAETDAQFAAVLAHELAHITLRHGATEYQDFVLAHPQYKDEIATLDKERAAIPRFDQISVASEAEWKKYLDALRSLAKKKWNAARAKGNVVAMNGLECESIGLWEKADALRLEIQKKLPSPDYESSLCQQFFATFNIDSKEATRLALWKEIEADEAGYEFFLKAGFPEDEYAQFFANVTQLSGPKSKDCERGNSDHPSDCWRAENIRAELKAHAKDLPAKRKVVTHTFKVPLESLRKEWLTAAQTN